MKRASKNLKQTPIVEVSTSVEPWAAWFWLESFNQNEVMNYDFSKKMPELDWVRSQLANHIPTVVIEGIDLVQRDPSEHSLVQEKRKSKPLKAWHVPTSSPTCVFLGSAARNDPIDAAIDHLRKLYPSAMIQLVLGEWWDGHRRTWPISTEYKKAYWYECHDSLIPELATVSHLRRNEAVPRLALAISENSTVRQTWLDVLPSLGFQPLVARDTNSLPEGEIDTVILDLLQQNSFTTSTDISAAQHGPVPSIESIASQVAILRQTYAKSQIVVCFGFPRWSEVSRCIQSGADLILGKPFRLEGLGKMLNRKIDSQL